ncbi:MAG: cyclic nucleotide-binding domain-containing protein [Acidimicrobiia bacterium]|nr:cyclic nucleotide-binding domain-containing protein [Acidimicrobiia bacterium]
MSFEFGRAVTPEEVEAAQRLRHTVYVEEMGRYRDATDAETGRFAEPEDDASWLFSVRDGDQVIATTRVTWGGHGFSARQMDQYELGPFLDELPAEVMAVAERLAVLPAYRGAGLLEQMIEHSRPFIEPFDIRAVFSCCEPHLLSMNLVRGPRPYATRNINSAEAGYLIPLIDFPQKVEALRGLGRTTRPDELAPCIERVLAQAGSIRSHSLSEADAYWDEIQQLLETLHAEGAAAFDGFTDDEAQRCIARSNIIECSAGDRVLKRGGSARNIFVVLSGTLEVRDRERIVGVLTAGDAFGEMAFLLDAPRSFDVDAATDQARVLSLSEGALRKMIAEDATVAAKLLLNVSKMLCVRLLKAN